MRRHTKRNLFMSYSKRSSTMKMFTHFIGKQTSLHTNLLSIPSHCVVFLRKNTKFTIFRANGTVLVQILN